MKKSLSILFSVFTALMVFTTTAFAAPAGRSVTLSSISYQKGGIVLIFETSGLTKADLKDNAFFADSNGQKMSCNFVDHTTTVRCTVSKALAGKGAFHVTLAGFGFWGELPEDRNLLISCDEGEEPWYIINVYENGELVESGEVPVWIWNELVSLGFTDELENEGITFEIVNVFCGPDVSEPE